VEDIGQSVEDPGVGILPREPIVDLAVLRMIEHQQDVFPYDPTLRDQRAVVIARLGKQGWVLDEDGVWQRRPNYYVSASHCYDKRD